MSDPTPPLAGRRVLVTGASSGIGRATVSRLAEDGATVVLAARSEDTLVEIAATLDTDNLAMPLDVTDPGACADAARRIESRFGGLDAVVNSAGVVHPGGVLDSEPHHWKSMFDVNVLGLLNITAAVVPMLRRSEPADIVNVSSMSGRRRASVALGIYAASKHAVHVLSDNLRDELSGEVRVTTISPGYVDTPIFDGAEGDDAEQYRRNVREQGLDPAAVAAQIAHALAQPAGVDLFEIAILSTTQ